MAKTDGSLGSLVQGVSQQPARARLPGQSEEQLNTVNDPVFGLSRRPAMEYLSTFDGIGGDEMEIGDFISGEEALGFAARKSTSVAGMRVLKGSTAYDVVIPAEHEDYMKMQPDVVGDNFIVKELDEHLYIVNRGVVVQAQAGAPTDIVRDTLVAYASGGKYSSTYRLDFEFGGNTHSVLYRTYDGSSGLHSQYATAFYIVGNVYQMCTEFTNFGSGIDPKTPIKIPDNAEDYWQAVPGYNYTTDGAHAAISAAFTFTLIGENIIIKPVDPALVFTITASESSGSGLFDIIRYDADDADNLPKRAPQGMVIKIEGSNREEDDYYLQWEIDDTWPLGTVTDEKGRWVECTAPDEDYRLDPATMPHELFWNGTTYEVRQFEWAERDAGNDESNPMPKMIGETISDLMDFQGRAVFLHGRYATMSQTDEYQKLFKSTATAELDTDPINIRSTATDGDSKLIYGVQFDRDLVLFATNNAQFMISGRSVVTPATASLVLTAEFDVNLSVRPRAAGENIMFTSTTGRYTHMHEMFLTGDQNSHARRTVTDHVTRYLEGSPKHLTVDDGSNTALLVCEDQRTIYVYKYLWADTRKVQSAWSTWTVSADIVNIELTGGFLYVTTQVADDSYVQLVAELHRIDEGELPFHVHLDYLTQVTLADETDITLECSGNTQEFVVCRADGSRKGAGLQVAGVTVVGNSATVELAKPYTGPVYVGEVFHTRYIPTMPVIRDADGVAVTEAKLTVSSFLITFENSGAFDMTRQSNYEAVEDYWTHTYTGRTLGDPDFLLGSVAMDSGTIDFSFEERVDTSKLVIECSTHLPLTITEIEWLGNVRNRSRRLTNGG